MTDQFVIFTRVSRTQGWTQAAYARNVAERKAKTAFYRANGYQVRAAVAQWTATDQAR
jgi:hypothetical protein